MVELLALQGMPDRDDHPYWDALTKQRKGLAPPPSEQQVVVKLPAMAAASQQREHHHNHLPPGGAGTSAGGGAALERPSVCTQRASLERNSGRTHRSRVSFDQLTQAHVHAHARTTAGSTKAGQSRLASLDLGSRQAPAAAGAKLLCVHACHDCCPEAMLACTKHEVIRLTEYCLPVWPMWLNQPQ